VKNVQRRILKGLAAVMAVAVVCLAFTGCGGKSAANKVYDEFKGEVNGGNWSAAYDLLSTGSKAKFGSAQKLQETLTTGGDKSIAKVAFGENANVRNTQSAGEGMITGVIQIFDADGKKIDEAGQWAVIKEGEGDGVWKIDWRLSTVSPGTGTGGAPGS
jgi:hypothetical protein